MPETKKTKPAAKKPARGPRINTDHPLANCHPRGARVVVLRDRVAMTTQGGIHLPESMNRAKLPLGTVVRVGPDVKGLAEGDRVLISSWGALEAQSDVDIGGDDKDYILLRDEDVAAILEK